MKRIVRETVLKRLLFGLAFGLLSPAFYFVVTVFVAGTVGMLNYTALAIAVPITSSIYVAASLLYPEAGANAEKRLRELALQGTPIYSEQIWDQMGKIRKSFNIIGWIGWILSVATSGITAFTRNWFFLVTAFLIPFFGEMATFRADEKSFETCPECHALESIVEDDKVPDSSRTETRQDEKTETYTETVATVYDDKHRVAGHVERDRNVKYVRDVTTEYHDVYIHCCCCGHKDTRKKEGNTTYGKWK